jgi:hypothetical protein
LGACYASAMSAQFKPDDVFLIAFFGVLVYRYIPSNLRPALFVSVLWSPVVLEAGICLEIGLVQSVVVLAIVALALILFLRWPRSMAVAVALAATVWVKDFETTYNWWESNIRGRDAVGFSSLGFVVTPFYLAQENLITQTRSYSLAHNVPLTVYSFPTSTLPYHFFNYLPPWQFAVHHADVFPPSSVNSEFGAIESVRPSFMFISRWTPEKTKELDAVFSPGRYSSQHLMALKIDEMLSADYQLCARVSAKPGERYSFPLELYIRSGYVDRTSQDFLGLCPLADAQ